MDMLRRGRRPVLLMVLFWHITRNDCKDTVSLIFGGDVMFGGVVKYMVERGDCTYNQSLQNLKPYIKDADFVVVNLETTLQLYDRTPTVLPKMVSQKKIHMVSDYHAIESLKNAGINYVTLANNHINDMGVNGVLETLRYLRKYGIKYFGITYGMKQIRQKSLILERNGVKIGILGYREKTYDDELVTKGVQAAQLDIEMAISEVNDLRQEGCDIVILFMHWGDEYTGTIDTPIVSYVQELVRDASIDVIVGAHPHVTQQHFYVNKTLVVPSLGNLLFPSHYSCFRNFQTMDRNISNLEKYVKVWAKQTLIKNPSSYGRLLKVEVNRNGIIPSKTKYLTTHILATKKHHCLVVVKKKNARWRVVCGKNDPQCMGTTECNVIECDGIGAFPDLGSKEKK